MTDASGPPDPHTSPTHAKVPAPAGVQAAPARVQGATLDDPASRARLERDARRDRLWKRILRVAKFVVPPIILFLLWRQLSTTDLGQARQIIDDAPTTLIVIAGLLAVVSVCVMGLYDVVAMPRAIPTRKRWLMGVGMFSWTNLLTIGPLGGPALRVYFYSRADVPIAQIGVGLARLYTGISCGMAAWLLASLLPLDTLATGIPGLCLRALLACVVAASLGASCSVLAPRIKRARLDGASPREMALVGLVGALDWCCVICIFNVCARALDIHIDPAELGRTYLVGHLAGAASMVPGGIGSADGVWLLQLETLGIDKDLGLSLAIVFRATFSLIPWALSIPIFAGLWAWRTFGPRQRLA